MQNNEKWPADWPQVGRVLHAISGKQHPIMALLCLSLCAACGPVRAPKPPPPTVGIIVIKATPLQLFSELPGQVSPFAVSEVRPQVSGIILRRLFTEGSTVKAGQPLYQIDPAPYQAAYDNAQATEADARRKSERYAALLKANAIAPQAADDAQASYLSAKANLETASINLNYTKIVAPIAGRIGASSVTEGALVTTNQAGSLATVSALDPIYVDISQSSDEVLVLRRALRKGQINAGAPAVSLVMADGSDYQHIGKLEFTDVTVDQTTGTVRLRAVFPNPDGQLLPGMSVQARIIEGSSVSAILAPKHGVNHDVKGHAIAFVADSKGIARPRVLTTGQSVGSSWLVLNGLKPGDKMIVEGLQKVRPNTPVTPIQAVPGQF